MGFLKFIFFAASAPSGSRCFHHGLLRRTSLVLPSVFAFRGRSSSAFGPLRLDDIFPYGFGVDRRVRISISGRDVLLSMASSALTYFRPGRVEVCRRQRCHSSCGLISESDSGRRCFRG